MTRMETVGIEVGTIDHGRFLKKANEQIQEASDKLVAFVTAHPASAKGAKAKLKMSITLNCGGGEPGFEIYGCKAESELLLPKEPAVAHGLDIEEGEGGVLELKTPFVAGMTEERQGRLQLRREEVA